MTPPSGSFLLDTNIVIAFLNRDETAAENAVMATEYFVPVVVLGELFFGAEKSGRPGPNKLRLEQFAARNIVLPCDLNTAREYGRLRQQLRSKGRPLPENDIWIAAMALAHGLILVTRDRHFRDVDHLHTVAWVTLP